MRARLLQQTPDALPRHPATLRAIQKFKACLRAEARVIARRATLVSGHFHDDTDAERCERRQIERSAMCARLLTDDAEMVDAMAFGELAAAFAA